MDMKDSKAIWSRKQPHGQSLVEFAMMAPILILLLAGLFEFGFLFSYYLAVLDSARNAARYSSDSLFDYYDSTKNCTSKDFYRQTACMAVSQLANEEPSISLCLWNSPASNNCNPKDWDKNDDVIVSVFSVLRKGGPDILRFPDGPPEGSAGDYGWSYDFDLRGLDQGDNGSRTGMHKSTFSIDTSSDLQADTPNTGYVLVEINYHYFQILDLPTFSKIIPDPIPLHIYSIWPCVSAEPTVTG